MFYMLPSSKKMPNNGNAPVVRKLFDGSAAKATRTIWLFAGLGICTAAVAIVFTVVFIALPAERQERQADIGVEHTQETIIAIGGIMADADDAETGQRGFLLTEDPTFLEPYNNGVKNVWRHFSIAEKLIPDSSSQQSRLPILRTLLQARLAGLSHILELAGSGNRDAAIDVVRSAQGNAFMDAIRQMTAMMVAEEQRMLLTRHSDHEKSRQWSYEILVILMTVGAGGILIGGVAITWGFLATSAKTRSEAAGAENAAALVTAETRHRISFEHSPVPLYTVDEDDVVTDVSNSWLVLLGYTRQEVIGQPVPEFRAHGSDSLLKTDRLELMTAKALHDVERSFLCRDGTVVEALVSARLERHNEVAVVVCTLIDITARRRAEELLRVSEDHLRQSQKMEALGQLAAGIAHDFNNILQTVSGAALLIERRPDDHDRIRGLARTMINAATRGASITQRLLSFARRGALRAEVIATADFLNSVQEVLAHTLGTTITVRASVLPGVPSLTADRGLLETALINMGINARDAMPGGGALTLSAEVEHVGERDQHEAGLAPGDYVRLSVADDGAGMSATTLARVAEPFFTTKQPGQGTGLGLSMVKGFAEQSGGGFSIASTPGIAGTPGIGTTVVMWLRQANFGGVLAHSDIYVAPVAAAPVAFAIAPRVLIVDDDDLVRETLAAQLEDHGFATLVAASGFEAIALIESGEIVDAMVSDLSMPGINGIETIKRARALRPLLPCFLLTGYVGEHAALSAENTFTLIHKPVSGEALAAQIEAHLVKV